jgi:hypothetical protein
MSRTIRFLAAAFLLLPAPACAPDAVTTPAVTLSPTRVPARGWVEVEGTGFTPYQNVTSHLLKPDGQEFPQLPILTDRDGNFTHEIDTLLLAVGTHELWVVDDTTGVTSNVARFDVTLEQTPVE